MKTNYILVLFSIFSSRCKMVTTKGFNVKLSESTLPFAGQVMINVDGSWASICDDGWNKINALVVCRQLSFSGAEAAISGNAFGAAPGPIVAKKFYCHGNETSLSECHQHPSITNSSCSSNTVASVLCTPPDDFLLPFVIVTFALSCLAITSIIILVLTCKAMPSRRQKHRNSKSMIAKSSEIGISNLNAEDIIESSTKREDKSLNKKSETLTSVYSGSDPSFPSSTLPDTELMVTSDERAHNCVDGNEGQITSPLTDAELIVPCSIKNVQHLDESKRKLAKHSESKKRRYMQLKRGSKALTHLYMKLVGKNRVVRLPTDVDRPNDFYGQTWEDKSAGAHQNITDEDSDSMKEYHEICSDSEEKKESVDKSAFEYVPMLSLSQMHKGASVELETSAQDEYLDILPPTDLQMENSSSHSGKRESDYLNPLERNLPSFPENFGDEALGSYDEELPEPPKGCEMLPTEREDERNEVYLNSVGLDNRECRCEKDLVCTKCLTNLSITIDNEIKPKDKGKDVQEQESDEDFEYMRMGEYDNIKSDNADIKTEVTRNSEGYAMPLKKCNKTNTKDHQNFSEVLNKRLLKQKDVNAPSELHGSVDKRLEVPNAYDSTIESTKQEVTIHENGTKCLSSPQNRRKIKENEKPPYKTSSHFYKQEESTLSEKDSFSERKKLFENKAAKDKEEKGRAFPRAVLSKSSSDSKEDKLNFKTDDGVEVGKSRSESCPSQSSTSISPNPSFLKSLESALKLANDPRSKAGTEKKSCTSEFVQDKEKKHGNIEMENCYELDYENMQPPTDSDYENNEIYSSDGQGSFSEARSNSDEFEYDYVNTEKQRKSLHFYEAVSKNSEPDDDDYENI